MAKGRPSKSGKRTKTGRLSRIAQPKDYGNERAIERKSLFLGVRKNAEGKSIDVSDDIFDAPGQLHALGFFDGHGHEPDLIRDTIRNYGSGYWARNADKAPKCGQYSRNSHGKDPLLDSPGDLAFERKLRALEWMRHDRGCLELLVCDFWWTDELPPFAQCLISDALRKLGRVVAGDHPGMNDHEILAGALRATFRLIETGLQARQLKRAA